MAGLAPAAERYRRSLKRAKQLFETHPRRFRARQALTAISGLSPPAYYVVLICFAAGGFGFGLFNRKGFSPGERFGYILAIVAAATVVFSVAYLLLRHRKANIDHAAGIDLQPQDAPRLFQTIAETRHGLRSPKVHKVQIGFGTTASIELLPAFGPFGPTRRRLILGMPMLAAISVDQAKAVIAHELAHSLRDAPCTPAWIEWIIRHWRGHLNREGRGFADASPEVGYFVKLTSMCDACSQYTERFADRKAADLYGARHLIDALLRISLMDAYSSDVYWPRLRRMQGHRALPPDTAYSAFANELIAGLAEEGAAQRIGRELLQGTLEDDSHPSLLDRLRELGWDQADAVDPTAGQAPSIVPPARPEPNAWDTWFIPASRVRLAAVLDRGYQEGAMQTWQAEHHRTQAAQDALRQDREMLAQLGDAVPTVPEARVPHDETGVLSAPLSAEPSDLTRTADLVGYAVPPDAAKPLLRGLLAIYPDLPHAHFHLGRLLLEEKDPACLEHFEKVSALSPILAGQARQQAFMYLRSIGRIEDAEKMRLEADLAFQSYQQFHNKLTSLNDRSSLSEHGLTQLDLMRLTRRLASYPVIARAYLFKRKDVACGDEVGHALCIQLKTKWYKYQRDTHMQRAEAALGTVFDLCVPNAVWVLNREGLKSIRSRVKHYPEALIYQA